MQCPNCKTELVQINGRYICSDCGKEVPESEINVGDWGQGSFGGSNMVPAPAFAVADEAEQVVDLPEDFIEPSAQLLEAAAKDLPAAVPNDAQEPPESKTDLVSASTNEEGEDGFYKPEKTSPDVDLDKLQETLEDGGKPVREPVVETTVTAQPEAGEQTQPQNADDLAPVPDPMYQLPGNEPALPTDPEIYEDPIYDEPAPEEPKLVAPIIDSRKSLPQDKKVLIGLIAGGFVLAVVFIIGGVYAYQTLSKKSQASTGNVVTPTPQTADCDSSGSDDAKAACIAENYAKCSAATWTDPYTTSSSIDITLGYQIQGLVDDSCDVNVTLNKNDTDSTTEGQAMVCALDSSLSSDEALTSMSSDTCTGDLSDYLFPTSDDSTDNSSTDTSNSSSNQ